MMETHFTQKVREKKVSQCYFARKVREITLTKWNSTRKEASCHTPVLSDLLLKR